jgi:hypothetical protein
VLEKIEPSLEKLNRDVYPFAYSHTDNQFLSTTHKMTTVATEPYYFKLESGEFQCKYCEKRTAKQNTMYYHVQTKHVQDFKFVCEHCTDKKFVQKSAYFQHMAQAHPEIAQQDEGKNPYVGVSYSCAHPECDQSAKTKANILVHFARTHCKDWIPTFSKENGCKCCDKKFSSSTAYFYHAVTSLNAPGDFATMLAKMK